MGIRIGIDSGGTFTDLIAVDDRTHQIVANKVPSTPSEPLTALREIIHSSTIPPESVSRLVLGTTVATNAIIERHGARVLFVTTRGFEDVLIIQTANRPRNYDLLWRRPAPFVKRRWCAGVRERIDHSGNVVVPLTDVALQELARKIEEIRDREGIEAIAVSLLFSYLNPRHEERLAEFLAQQFPSLPLSVSHRLAPIWREYERANTTVADAFIKPLVTRYIFGARAAFASLGVNGAHCLMKSNGGMALLEAVPDRPLDTLLSGLVAGAIAGQFFGRLTEQPNALTFDMGGTSCDVGLIVDGSPKYTTRFDVEWGLPISNPTVDVRTVGAGGGSIGWIDRGGFLRVGPQSAGAEPGPASYGAGGAHPTVTDANLALGRLNPNYFLGGKMKLSVGLAEAALERLAAGSGLSMRQTARAMLDVVNDNMASTIRLITVEKGIDPRGFALVAFGGAGPLHACSVARELQIPTVVIPVYPGQCSAFGTLIADVRIDRVWTHDYRSDRLNMAALVSAFDTMVADARQALRRSGFDGEPIVQRSISLRYLEQNYEEDILLADGPITETSLKAAYEGFHRRHELFYGYSFPEETLELVHFKVSTLGAVPTVQLPKLEANGVAEPRERRPVFLSDPARPEECPVYNRRDLTANMMLAGPAIIEEESSTTLVEADYLLRVDSYGNLVLTREKTP
jgi:N-methylhydantoinase A